MADRGISAAPPPHPVFLKLCQFTDDADAIHRRGGDADAIHRRGKGINQWTIINYYHTM